MLTISALDIFASALGVFMLVSILMFPNYLKQPAVEAEQAGAQAELAAAGDDAVHAREALAAAIAERTAAETARAQAQARLSQAEAMAARAAQVPQPEVAAPVQAKAAGEKVIRIAIADLDLVFVMDTTGSMGPELADLQANLVGIIRVLSRLSGSLRVGFVAFKDRGDVYVTRVYPLQRMNEAHVAELINFVNGLRAQGGGDDPEPVDEALAAALAMPWRADAEGRIIVVGDASAHAHRHLRTLDLAGQFHGSARDDRAPRTVSAIFTGDGPASRSFFEQLAVAGGGDLSVHQGQMIESVLLSVLKQV